MMISIGKYSALFSSKLTGPPGDSVIEDLCIQASAEGTIHRYVNSFFCFLGHDSV
jgi:hypothetical protein